MKKILAFFITVLVAMGVIIWAKNIDKKEPEDTTDDGIGV